jgi:hypothetical protein
MAGELAGEAVGVAGLVFGGVGGAGQLRPDVAQRRLDLHRLVGRDHAAVAAQRAHLRGRCFGAVELFLAGVEVQDALGALLVLQAELAAHLLQRLAAVGAQAHDLLDVVPRARGGALAKEAQAPQPLLRVGAQAEEQRCVFLAQPLEHLQRCAGVGPGLGVADRHLPAVGEAGFGGGRGLAVDHGDVVALLAQEMGRGDAEQAGAEDEDSHDGRELQERQ